MRQFWEASRSWFAERGFHLFETDAKLISNAYRIIWLRPLTFNEQQPLLPYAVCIPPEPSSPRQIAIIVCYFHRHFLIARTNHPHQRQLGYAHDSDNRNVVIRLVQNGSNHHRIFQRLLEDGSFSHPLAFPGVLPPVAILDTPHKYSFVVMPM